MLQPIWKKVKIKQLGTIIDGDWILNKDYSSSGVRLIQVGDVGVGKFADKSSRYITQETAHKLGCTFLHKGDILISRMPDPIGRACILPDLGCEAITAVDVSIWRPDPDITDRDFLVYYLSTQEWFSRVRGFASGATRPRISRTILENMEIPLPPLAKQQQIAEMLNNQIGGAKHAHRLVAEQSALLSKLIHSYLRESIKPPTTKRKLGECLDEVKNGIGENWNKYPVIGATRLGVAPAKEKVGKKPERYKLVEPGTIFYNPMRINIGSIAMLDEDDEPAITSPDYVVFKSKKEVIHPRWFYYWLRSVYGERFIKTLARGAVRERMLFNRLKNGEIDLPSWEIQCITADRLLKIKALDLSIKTQLSEINQLPTTFLWQVFNGALH